MESRDEAIEWARRAPNPHGPNGEGEIEIRQVFEMEDFEPSTAIERERKLLKELAKEN